MRISARSLAGAVAMLTLGASVVLSQDSTRTRPTSTRRIPITKEGGEVARKVDTVTVYRTDTLRVNVNTPPTIVHDTVTQTRTVTRVDTVTTTYYPPVRLPNGLYFGMNGGVNAPNGAIYNPNGAGPTVGAQLGWQGAKNENTGSILSDEPPSQGGCSAGRMPTNFGDATLGCPE